MDKHGNNNAFSKISDKELEKTLRTLTAEAHNRLKPIADEPQGVQATINYTAKDIAHNGVESFLSVELEMARFINNANTMNPKQIKKLQAQLAADEENISDINANNRSPQQQAEVEMDYAKLTVLNQGLGYCAPTATPVTPSPFPSTSPAKGR